MKKIKKVVTVILAFAMILGFIPVSLQQNEVKAAGELPKTTLKPKPTVTYVNTLLNWEPNNDSITEQINKSSVDLRNRSKGKVVNELASKDAKIQVLSLMNAKGDGVSSVGSDMFKSYAFDFWQYTDTMIFWDGVIPTPDVIDAAHRNGVPLYGTLFFNWSTSDADNQIFQDFVKEDNPGSGTYPTARKLAEIAKFYKFDGYFINQETVGWGTQGKAEHIKNLMIYAKKYAEEELNYPIKFSWYDAMTVTGSRAHQDSVNSSNDFVMKSDDQGKYAADSFFMNFNWDSTKVTSTNENMTNINRNPYDAHAGFELQANSYNTRIRRDALLGTDNKLKVSLGLFTPDSIVGLSKDGEDYHEQERKFWVGFNGDPVTSNDSNLWSGMARFVADKTPITSLPFNTYFNTGHGKNWFIDGELSREKEWTSRSVQEILPTWRWWIRSNTDSVLKGRYDFDDAYNSGTSISFVGDLNQASTNDIMLYSTDVQATENTKLKLAFKGGSGSIVKIGLTKDSEYSTDSFVYYDLDLNGSESWKTQVIDLSGFAGQNIKAIKLQIINSENVSGYKFNLGQLSMYDNDLSTSAPQNLVVKESLVHTARTAEALVSYDKVSDAEYYELYQKTGGEWKIVNATSSNIGYLGHLTRGDLDEGTTQEIKVVAVLKNGQKTEASTAVVDWGLTINDTEEPLGESENVVLGAEKIAVSGENQGELAINALNDTIAGNADKWCTLAYKGYLDIKLTEPRTVRRWLVNHAGAGGESVNDGLMNTKDFDLQYKINPEDEWTTLKSIDGNIAHVTDVNIENPVTAQYWRLNIRAAHNGSPWGAIRIYNWKMYETPVNNKTDYVPMQYVSVENTKENNYNISFANVSANTLVKIYKDVNKTELLTEVTTSSEGKLVINDIKLEGNKGLVYYTTKADQKDESIVLATEYVNTKAVKSVVLSKQPDKLEYYVGENLDLTGAELNISYGDSSSEVVKLPDERVVAEGFESTLGTKTVTLKFNQFEVEGSIEIKVIEKLKEDGWKLEDGHEKYFINGKPLTGLQKIGQTTYLFNSKGEKQKGWHNVNGKELFFSLENGGMLTGLRKVGQTIYLLTSEGKQKGWHKINGKELYFSTENGGMLTGLRKIGQTTYLLTSEGKQKGWHRLNGNDYYFLHENGGMVTGIRLIGKTKYEFNSQGHKLRIVK